MESPDATLYEYAVVRYVPRVDREEFINIGLIMMCKRRKWLRGEIRINENRTLTFDPKANIGTLASQSTIFTRDDVPSKDLPVEERYRWLTAVKSAVLQISPSHPGLLVADENSCGQDALKRLEEEFERLFSQLVTY